jgi:hypothetical protein
LSNAILGTSALLDLGARRTNRDRKRTHHLGVLLDRFDLGAHEARRPLMEAYAQWLMGEGANVIAFPTRA